MLNFSSFFYIKVFFQIFFLLNMAFTLLKPNVSKASSVSLISSASSTPSIVNLPWFTKKYLPASGSITNSALINISRFLKLFSSLTALLLTMICWKLF
jgi:hypothetical protein